MKRKSIMIGIIVIVITVMLAVRLVGVKPFKELSADEISKVSVELFPPGASVELSEEEIRALVEILHTVVIYRKDDSYGEYSGQAVVYTITMNDGSELMINGYNPFLVVDGTGYRTKYAPCEELCRFGNAVYDNSRIESK